MFSHICLGTNNLSESISFYDQVMPTLNIQRQETGETYACYGDIKDVGSGINCLFIGETFNGNKATAGNGVNVALLAETRNQVREFYEIAIKSGGVCDGAPGSRDVHPNFFAAYVLDPTGNKLVVVCHSSDDQNENL